MRLQLQQADQWSDQAQRDKISLHGELELRNRIFRENQGKDCQDIEELRRICCEETDRASQARIGELIVYASREESHNCESIVGSDSGFTEQRKFFCHMRENFTILKQREALESTLDYVESQKKA